MTVTIYHNPACGTSRNVLGLIRDSGEEPTVVEYLKTPPSREELADLVRRMGIGVRGLLRRKGTPYDELGLDDPGLDATVADQAEHVARRPAGRVVVDRDLGHRLRRPPPRARPCRWRRAAVAARAGRGSRSAG